MSFHITDSAVFFSSKEERLSYLSSWKERARARNLSAEDFLIHALLMGKDLYRAFSPSKRALVQNNLPYSTLANLLYWLVPPSAQVLPEGPAAPEYRLRAFLQERRAGLRLAHRQIATGTMGPLSVGEAQ